MQLKPKSEHEPPPTNTAYVNNAEKPSFDDDLEKVGSHPGAELDHSEHPKHDQQHISPDAERAVVRKLDWKVRSCFNANHAL